jgi:cell wall-associated NlpC family hydrolase
MNKNPLFVWFFFAINLAVFAQQLPVIIIVNDTDFTIHSIYLSPASSTTWGQDILRGGTLQKSSYICELSSPLTRESVYDIMLKNNEGNRFIKWDVQVSDNMQIVFTANDLAKGDNPEAKGVVQFVPVSGASASNTSASGTNAGSLNAVRSAIVKAAQRYIGARYVYGSQSPPDKFDCSGLVNQAYKDGANIEIPRSTSEIWAKGRKISKADLAPGDIIVFSENRLTPSHVAIYVDETYMIHSVSIGSPTGVIQNKQSDGSWSGKVIGYVTFVGLQAASSVSAREPTVTEFPVLAASFLNRSAEVLAVQAGTGMSFVVTNGTGIDSDFDILFYKEGNPRANDEKEALSIANGASRASKTFFFAEKGQYRLEISSRKENKTLLEYTFNVEE